MGRCHPGLSPFVSAATDADFEGRYAEGGGGESNGREDGWRLFGWGAESGGITLIDISSRGDSGVQGEIPTKCRLPIQKGCLWLKVAWGVADLGWIRWTKSTCNGTRMRPGRGEGGWEPGWR